MADKSITKTELVASIASATGQSQSAVSSVLDSLFATVSEAVAKGNKVSIPGWLSFEQVETFPSPAAPRLPQAHSLECDLAPGVPGCRRKRGRHPRPVSRRCRTAPNELQHLYLLERARPRAPAQHLPRPQRRAVAASLG